MALPPSVQDIFAHLSSEDVLHTVHEQTVAVHSLTSKAGKLYEKLRYLVDYHEEHAIRRSAIERILKRKLLIENVSVVGRPLLEELIIGGYVQNNHVPERTTHEIDQILEKYHSFLYSRTSLHSIKSIRDPIQKSLFAIASAEIEQHLFPQPLDEAIVDALYTYVRQSIHYPALTPAELDTHIYIACRRTLLHDDDARLRFALWQKIQGEDKYIHDTAEHITKINHALDSTTSIRIASHIHDESVYFLVLREVIAAYGTHAQEVFDDAPTLNAHIHSFLAQQYTKVARRARSSGMRAALYLFCTKILLAFLIEVPYEFYILGSLNYFALGTNVVLPPFILLSMTRVSEPDERNTKAIIVGVHAALDGSKMSPVTIGQNNRTGFTVVLSFLYLLLFIFTFSAIIGALTILNFTFISIALFLLFLTLVTYFGIRIRYHSRMWRLTAHEGAPSFLFSILTLPIIRVGKWLSHRFTSINIFVFLLDIIIETPFKLLLSVLDAFITYLKEIREQTY